MFWWSKNPLIWKQCWCLSLIGYKWCCFVLSEVVANECKISEQLVHSVRIRSFGLLFWLCFYWFFYTTVFMDSLSYGCLTASTLLVMMVCYYVSIISCINNFAGDVWEYIFLCFIHNHNCDLVASCSCWRGHCSWCSCVYWLVHLDIPSTDAVNYVNFRTCWASKKLRYS